MKNNRRVCQACRIFFLIILGISVFSVAYAELKLDSVYPSIGEIGRQLEVKLNGSGFTDTTRVSMFLDAGNARATIGSVDTPGRAGKVTIEGQTAYLADFQSGLQIIDISNPLVPQIIGSVDTPGYAEDVAVQGDRAYIADGARGLQVIDISDPTSPWIMGSADTPDYAYGVAVTGNRAYVADDSSGLQIINISDPYHPSIIVAVDTPGYALDVAIVNDIAYVADKYEGLQIIDIAGSGGPSIIGSVDTPGQATRIGLLEDNVYVADHWAGLQVVDISSPAAPQIIGSAETPSAAFDIAIADSKAYIANYNSGLQMIDIDEPTNPQIIGSVDTSSVALGVAIVNSRAYVAASGSGLQVIDISSPKIPQIFSSVDTPGYASDIAIVGDLAYITDHTDGLMIIDISQPANPGIIGSVDTPGSASGIAIANDRAFVADYYNGLQVIDISDPADPRIITTVDTPDRAYDVAVAGGHAYVADFLSGLQIIDISTPPGPRIVGSVNTPQHARGVTVSGDRAYIADTESGLQVIDISDPASPTIIGSIITPGWAAGVRIVGNRAYVADWPRGLQVIDISDPQNLEIIGGVDTPSIALDVFISGNMAYVADGGSGIQAIDISDPATPLIVGSVDTPGEAVAVNIPGDKAYVADGYTGLVVVPLPVEIEPVTVLDETSISLTLNSPLMDGYYTLRVFDETESDTLAGAITYLNSEDYLQITEKKAIIVAGYRSYPDDALWDKTRLCVHMAYLSLLTQGYTADSIYYLGPEASDLDGDGYNDVDAEANFQNLSGAISNWAQGTSELLLFITDHGGTETFQLNENQILDANILDDWLDQAQATISDRIIFVYDACKSGSFIPLLTPPAGKERIVISSAMADEYAWFENNGVLSFSYQFWAYLQLDATLVRAFNTAASMMQNDQTALLDANGNGVPNEKEDDISGILIGRGRVAGSVPPVVGRVSGKQILDGGTTASFWAANIASLNPVVQVWAVIVPPGDRPADNPVIAYSKVDLLDADQDGTYEASHNEFTSVGTYQVLVYARDTDGAISLPKKINISQITADSYEDDDTFSSANVIVLNNPSSQLHNFHDHGDADWVKFYALFGETYTFEAYHLGHNCDAVIEIYDTDGTTLLAEQDTIGDPNADERLDWSCPGDGIYFVKIKQYYATTFGDGSEYDLKVYRSIAPFPGFVIGAVTEALSGQELGDVRISTSANASALSLPEGDYMLIQPAGTFSITASKPGYASVTYPDIHLDDKEVITRNFALMPQAGDSDGDGIPDAIETASECLDVNDDDTDDDGIIDGNEDSDHDGVVDAGETDPCEEDTDGDGLQDGTEIGLTEAQGEDTDSGVFIPDADPATTTDPLDEDTDNDGWLDGEEDSDHNGRVDPGEKDPNHFDVTCLPQLLLLLL